MSKYSISEFSTGVKYYKGTYSPNTAERREKGYSYAWLHHKGRNKHHWEFWVDFGPQGPFGAKMPYRYVIEMFCDRVAAGMIYNGDRFTIDSPIKYYKDKCSAYVLHPDTEALIIYLLEYLAEHGLDDTLNMIRHKYSYEDYEDILLERKE